MTGLFLERKAITYFNGTFKGRDISLNTKIRMVKAVVFFSVTYGYEGWAMRKSERRRVDAFELWYLRKLLREPECKKIQRQFL